jgi:hypothetical protein
MMLSSSSSFIKMLKIQFLDQLNLADLKSFYIYSIKCINALLPGSTVLFLLLKYIRYF